MTISNEVEEASDMISSLTDELVYEDQTVCPEDMYFVSLLLDEYYDSQSEQAIGGHTGVCDVAWMAACEMAEYVADDEDFDWLNAYFVIDGLFSSYQSEYIEYPDYSDDPVENPSHYQSFSGFSESKWRDMSETPLEGTEQLLREIQEIAELYVNFEDGEKRDESGMDKPRELSMTIGHIGKRYAHEFPDDIMESYVGFETVDFLMKLRDSDTYSERDIYFGLRLATEWAELRAKREHEMLCIGLE